MRITFGKYAGYRIEELPTSYLAWLHNNCKDIDRSLGIAIWMELIKRTGKFSGQQSDDSKNSSAYDAKAIISEWFATLSRRFHPDRGGHPERMVALNEAHAELKKLFKV